MKSQESNKMWLVKSSGRILGPYAQIDLVELLKSRKISIIDEIRDPQNYWSFIREHTQFAELVQDLRHEDAISLDTTTAGSRTRTITADVNVREEHTAVPLTIPPKITETRPSQRVASGSTPMASPKLRRQRKSSAFSLTTTFLWALVITSIGAATYFFIQARKNLTPDDLLQLAPHMREIGEYEKSLQYFRMLSSQRELDPVSKIQMASVLIEETPNIVEARRLLEEAIPKINAGDKLRNEAQNYLGRSFLKEGQYNRAEQIFRSILFTEENNPQARMNLAMSLLLKSDFDAAHKEFVALEKRGIHNLIVVIGKTIALLALSEGRPDVVKFEDSLKELERATLSSQENQLESQLVLSVLQQKLGSSGNSQRAVEAMFRLDPDLSRKHVVDLSLDRQILKWDRLVMYCDFLMTKWGDTALSKALGSYCSYQKGEIGQAVSRVEEARAIFPSDPTLIGLHSFLLFTMGRSEHLALARMSESESELGMRVMARSCERQKNWACSERYWNQLLTLAPNDLDAIRGLITSQNLPNSEKSQELLRRGLNLSPNYKPLLILKEAVNGN